MLSTLCGLMGSAFAASNKLESDVDAAKKMTDAEALADFFKSDVLDDMAALRSAVDSMESVAGSKAWPYPSYGELLYGVR